MSYKRLTIRDEFGNADIFGVDSELLYNELSFTEANALTKAFNRLALLEDKIESHKLVELKYRNGDYVFFISWLSGNVCEGTVVDWQEDSGYCIISGNDMISAYECFSTKAEAEKKLEELSKNP